MSDAKSNKSLPNRFDLPNCAKCKNFIVNFKSPEKGKCKKTGEVVYIGQIMEECFEPNDYANNYQRS